MVNPNTTTLATLFKIMRIIMLVFVVLYFGFRSKKQTKGEQATAQIKIKRNAKVKNLADGNNYHKKSH